MRHCFRFFFVMFFSAYTLSLQAMPQESATYFPEAAIHPASLAALPAYEVPYRILTSKDPSGLVVELDDGSTWRIVEKGGAQKIAHYWAMNDRLVIFPTLLPFWSGARFYLYNERLSDSIYAELSLGPIAGRASTNEIYVITPEAGLCQLVDGIGRTSNWAIHPDDASAFLSWRPNQAVIIGGLTGSVSAWFTRYNPGYILINVEKNTYVRAALQ